MTDYLKLADEAEASGRMEAYEGNTITGSWFCSIATAIRELVAESERLREALATAVRDAVNGLSRHTIETELSPPSDEYGRTPWWFNDAESFRAALLAALDELHGKL